MIAGRLKNDGELQTTSINTRLPLITKGLVAHYPFDGTTSRYLPTSIRYIRDWLNGSDKNTGSHWVEIQAFDYEGVNRCLTALSPSPIIIDGLTNSASYYGIEGTGNRSVTIDLQSEYSIKEIRIWHYYADLRKYNNTKTEISEDGINWFSVFDSDIEGIYTETSLGKIHDLSNQKNLGTTINPTTEIGTTITNTGVCIETATTNLASPVIKSYGPWGEFTSRIEEYKNEYNRPGIYIETYTAGGAKWCSGGVNIPVSSSTVYTVSAKIKFNGNPHPNLFYIRQFNSGGTQLKELGYFSLSRFVELEDGWGIAYGTFTTEATCIKLSIDAYEYTAGRQIWIEDIQLEQKEYPTQYAETSRIQGQLGIANPVKTGNYTISFEHKNTLSVGLTGGYHSIMSMGNYSTNNSWTIMDAGNPLITNMQRLIRKGNDATWGWLSGNLTTATTVAEWTTITIVRDSTNYKAYSNGKFVGQLAHLATTMQDILWIGGRQNSSNSLSSIIRNLSIFNRDLVDSEVLTLAKGTHKFTKTELISHGIRSMNSIPNDAYFFDLGFSGKSINSFITPSEDTANYSDGDAYVGGNSLEYNLFNSIGLSWAGDWSICYMKKPIGTQTGVSNLTGYSIESLGSNANSVGGGYLWWGKPAGGNSIDASSNAAINPSNYFNQWQYITLVKIGTVLTINTWLSDKLIRVRTIVINTSAPNYFVNQYGYDFKLSGWDNNLGCYTRFKNLVVLKRAMTQSELDNFRLTKMKAKIESLQIQSNINTVIQL